MDDEKIAAFLDGELDEAQILGIDRAGQVVNCGVCEYDFQPDDAKDCVPVLARYNFAAPLIEEASEQPARRSGISTVLSGERIFEVSAMKCTPACTMMSACRNSSTGSSRVEAAAGAAALSRASVTGQVSSFMKVWKAVRHSAG